LLNEIKEVSFRANIEPVWNTEVCGTPAQLGFLELNYFSREDYGGRCRIDNLYKFKQNPSIDCHL